MFSNNSLCHSLHGPRSRLSAVGGRGLEWAGLFAVGGGWGKGEVDSGEDVEIVDM